MLEAIIICDALCLSKNRIVRHMKAVQAQSPEFVFRFASQEESKVLLKNRPVKILPVVFLGEHTFEGVPTPEVMLNALSHS